MQQGYISLHREIKDHWIYKEKIYSNFQAWVDILLSVNHKDNKILLGNQLIEVKRGSFITSELKLMKKFGWGKTKLRNFLNLLEKDEMIQKVSDKNKTTIFVLNYDKFQTSQTTDKPLTNHGQTTDKPQANTNNNDNNENNDNKINHSSDDERESDYKNKKIELEKAFDKFWTLYPKKVNKKKAEQRFMNLSLKILENLFIGLDLYIKKWNIEKTQKQFIPGPEVWIGNEKWCDEIIIEGAANNRSEQEIKEKKDLQKQEADQRMKNSEKVSAEKKELLDFWNSLSSETHEEIKQEALRRAMKRFPDWDEEKLNGPFGKPILKAETGKIIKEMRNK